MCRSTLVLIRQPSFDSHVFSKFAFSQKKGIISILTDGIIILHREYFMESAGVRFLHTSCFCIRNRTSERSQGVRFLIQKQLVCKNRTPALYMWYCVYCIDTETFIILVAFLF